MTIRSLLFSALLAVSSASAAAQTTVMARPVSDSAGNAAFQIVQIIRLEGEWEKAPVVGQVLYPLKQTKAFPLIRFGEAVLISLPEPDDFTNWSGYHIHNGHIPALNGVSAKSVITEIAHRRNPDPETLAPQHDLRSSAKGKLGDPRWNRGACPICGQVHIRI